MVSAARIDSVPCQVCQKRRGFAWATADEVEAGYGSIHDTHYFVWLKALPAGFNEGPICDPCLDQLIEDCALEAYRSDRSGPAPNPTEAAAAAAYQLGAKRLAQTLSLPVNDRGEIVSATFNPFSKSDPAESPRVVLLWKRVAGLAGHGGGDEDPYASGALHALIQVAIGTPFDSLTRAEKAKLWARDRTERREQDANGILLDLETI